MNCSGKPKTDALVISNKKTIEKQIVKSEAIIKKSSPTAAKNEDTIKARGRSSRVIDLVALSHAGEKVSNQQEIGRSVNCTIKNQLAVNFIAKEIR